MTHGMPGFPSPLDETPRRPRNGRIVLALVAMVLLGSAAMWFLRRDGDAPAAATVVGTPLDDSSAYAPEGARIRVRVVNATSTRGLARRATLVLRDFGYDVVEYGSELNKPRTRTVVVQHNGPAEWIERLQRALDISATTDNATDSVRYVDVTVYIGSDWKPPTQPLRP